MQLTILDGVLLSAEVPPEETAIQIPEGVNTIHLSAFGKAAHIRHLYLPDSLAQLDPRVITRCPMLSDLSLHARLLEHLDILPPLHMTVRGELHETRDPLPMQSLICPDMPLHDLPQEYRKKALSTFIHRYHEPQLWQDDIYQCNDQFARKNTFTLIRMANKDAALWHWLMAQQLLPKEQVKFALMNARLSQDTALIAALMNYRSDMWPEEGSPLKDSLLDDFDREMEALIDPETDEQKALLWELSRFDNSVQSYQGYEKSITFPRVYKGKKLTAISSRIPYNTQLKHYRQLRNIVVPSGYTEIGENAFLGVGHLDSLSLPATIREMEPNQKGADYMEADVVYITHDPGDEPGLGCLLLPRKVKKIIVEEGVTVLPLMTEEQDEVFSSLRQLILPRSLQKLIAFPGLRKHNIALKVDRDHPFLRRTSEGCLLSRDGKTFYYAPETLYGRYDLPDTVRTVMPYAFCGCENLTAITLPEGLEHLCGHAFENCSRLSRVRMPDTLLSVGECCFSSCGKLTIVRFSPSLLMLGKRAFHGCPLYSAFLPDSLKTIGSGAFSCCKCLNEVHLPDHLAELPAETFDSCTALRELTLPSQLTAIHGLAFRRCFKLTLDIPISCTAIASTAFLDVYQCTLKMSAVHPLRVQMRKTPGITLQTP